MSYHYDDMYRGRRFEVDKSLEYKTFMENFLISIDLMPEPFRALNADMLAAMSATACAQFGQSDTMLVSQKTYDAFKKFRK